VPAWASLTRSDVQPFLRSQTPRRKQTRNARKPKKTRVVFLSGLLPRGHRNAARRSPPRCRSAVDVDATFEKRGVTKTVLHRANRSPAIVASRPAKNPAITLSSPARWLKSVRGTPIFVKISFNPKGSFDIRGGRSVRDCYRSHDQRCDRWQCREEIRPAKQLFWWSAFCRPNLRKVGTLATDRTLADTLPPCQNVDEIGKARNARRAPRDPIDRARVAAAAAESIKAKTRRRAIQLGACGRNRRPSVVPPLARQSVVPKPEGAFDGRPRRP